MWGVAVKRKDEPKSKWFAISRQMAFFASETAAVEAHSKWAIDHPHLEYKAIQLDGMQAERALKELRR